MDWTGKPPRFLSKKRENYKFIYYFTKLTRKHKHTRAAKGTTLEHKTLTDTLLSEFYIKKNVLVLDSERNRSKSGEI